MAMRRPQMSVRRNAGIASLRVRAEREAKRGSSSASGGLGMTVRAPGSKDVRRKEKACARAVWRETIMRTECDEKKIRA